MTMTSQVECNGEPVALLGFRAGTGALAVLYYKGPPHPFMQMDGRAFTVSKRVLSGEDDPDLGHVVPERCILEAAAPFGFVYRIDRHVWRALSRCGL